MHRPSKQAVNLGILVALSLFTGCDDPANGGNGNGGGGALFDGGPEASIWDASNDGGVPRRDMAILRDAEPAQCLSEGVTLVQRHETDPIAGAYRLDTHLDLNGDGQHELLVYVDRGEGTSFIGLDAQSWETVFEVGPTGLTDVEFRPFLHAFNDESPFIELDGARAYYLRGTNAEGQSVLRFFQSESHQALGEIIPEAGFQNASIFRTHGQWYLANNGANGGEVMGLSPQGQIYARELSEVRLGWDLNGDGEREVVRFGRAGLAVVDLSVGEEIASLNGVQVDAVSIPDEGPKDLRGAGPEVLAVELAENALYVRYLDPVELTQRIEPQVGRATSGVFVKAEVIDSGDLTRIVAQFDRGGLQYLTIFEPGEELRRRGPERGPFRHLHWQLDADANGDGSPDLMFLGGSNPDWMNTDITFVDLRLGSESYQIEAERSARFAPIWRSGTTPTPADLDGCEGIERVAMRLSARRENGYRASRFLIWDEEGRNEYFRSEPHDGPVHELSITDTDGSEPPELIELRNAVLEDGSTDPGSAIIRVFGTDQAESNEPQ